MTRDEMIAMTEAMSEYGGSFVRNLANCFLTADKDNLERLYKAFPEYVKQYSDDMPPLVKFMMNPDDHAR
jgi:hypothetical protein